MSLSEQIRYTEIHLSKTWVSCTDTLPVFNFRVTSEDDRRRQLSTAGKERDLLGLNLRKDHRHSKEIRGAPIFSAILCPLYL